MAGTATERKVLSMPNSAERQAIIEHNKIIDDMELIRTATGGSALLRELHDDHATFKTAVDGIETLIEELHDDHATLKTSHDQMETLIEELHDDHATNKTLLDEALFKLAFLIHRDQNRSTTGTSPVFAIDTNFDVKNTETCAFVAAGVPYTLTDNTSCDTGTAKTIAADQWAAMVIDATNATTLTGTWTADAASEAAAIALAKAVPFVANKARLGYVAVQTAVGQPWIAGTDALATGTGGNVANATNYYQFFELVALTGTTTAATLTAPKPASGPATLTAAKPASAPATLTASAPTSTALDAAGDLLAAKINENGSAVTE